MLSNFLGCPTIDDEATKMEEPQPVLNRETEDTKRNLSLRFCNNLPHYNERLDQQVSSEKDRKFYRSW